LPRTEVNTTTRGEHSVKDTEKRTTGDEGDTAGQIHGGETLGVVQSRASGAEL
jgi:hypothetical protein